MICQVRIYIKMTSRKRKGALAQCWFHSTVSHYGLLLRIIIDVNVTNNTLSFSTAGPEKRWWVLQVS